MLRSRFQIVSLRAATLALPLLAALAAAAGSNASGNGSGNGTTIRMSGSRPQVSELFNGVSKDGEFVGVRRPAVSRPRSHRHNHWLQPHTAASLPLSSRSSLTHQLGVHAVVHFAIAAAH